MSKPDPKLVLKFMNEQFRKKEAVKLYREILKTCKLFTWTDEKGVKWGDIIRYSAREEFESSKQEKDPEVLARALVNAQMALTELHQKYTQKQEELKKQQDLLDDQLKRDIEASRVTSKYEKYGK